MLGWLFGPAQDDDDLALTPDLIEDDVDNCHFEFDGCPNDDLLEIEHTGVPMLICPSCASQL